MMIFLPRLSHSDWLKMISHHDLTKRFYLFGFDSDYATGGLHDLIGTFDTLIECSEHVRRCAEDIEDYTEIESTQILDRERGVLTLVGGFDHNLLLTTMQEGSS